MDCVHGKDVFCLCKVQAVAEEWKSKSLAEVFAYPSQRRLVTPEFAEHYGNCKIGERGGCQTCLCVGLFPYT